jgi:hypothetical protein
MSLAFWNNPEFIRYRRAELRPARMGYTALLVHVVAALVFLAIYSASSDTDTVQKIAQIFYGTMMWATSLLLLFWTLGACVSAIASERQNRTFDFWRTTSLSPSELLVGKLFGAPIVAYFTFLVAMPVTIVAGAIGGYGVHKIVASIALILLMAVVVGLFGLMLSTKMEKNQQGAIAILLVFGYPLTMMAMVPEGGVFPALRAFTPLRAIYQWHGLNTFEYSFRLLEPAKFFGMAVPWAVATLILHAIAIFWLVRMIQKAIKREPEEGHLFTRYESLAFMAFMNLMFFALLDPHYRSFGVALDAKGIAAMAVGFNYLLLVFVGILMISSPEAHKVWWRSYRAKEGGWLTEDAPAWPVVGIGAAIAFVMLFVYAAGLHLFPLADWKWPRIAVSFIVAVVFVARDVTFLQWCNLTRMKRATVKGVMLLFLYYAAASIAIALFTGNPTFSRNVAAVLTPVGIVDDAGWNMVAIAIGIGLQIGLTLLVLRNTFDRLSKPAKVLAVTAA